MSEATGIQWTQKTWNPWQGCTKVSPGCAHCYMFREKRQYGQNPEVVVRSKPPTFNAPLKWPDPALAFTCSWSDFLHPAADAWRGEAWDIIRRTRHITYQILTKRPERLPVCLPADWGDGWPNVWLMTSVENQHWADIRIPQLLAVPAVVHGLSCEPLLGPLDLHLAGRNYGIDHPSWSERVDWVIVGGESGGKEARPMPPAWVESLIAQCQEAEVACFVKQLGSVWARSVHAHDWHGGDMSEWPEALRVREFPQEQRR